MKPNVKPDFGLTSKDYARHRAGFPNSLFEKLSSRGIGKPKQSLVDLGTGTGSLARGFAARGCKVIGIDPAEEMLSAARTLNKGSEFPVDYRVATAECTNLASAAFDIVSAGQCWHWFDRLKAAKEALRILKPGGKVVIAHFDWLPLSGNVVRATEALIELHNPEWNMGGGLGMYPQWLTDLGEAGFHDIETFTYDIDEAYTPQAWRGRIRASAGVGGTLSSAQVKHFDEALGRLLEERYPGAILKIPHRVFAVIAHAPG